MPATGLLPWCSSPGARPPGGWCGAGAVCSRFGCGLRGGTAGAPPTRPSHHGCTSSFLMTSATTSFRDMCRHRRSERTRSTVRGECRGPVSQLPPHSRQTSVADELRCRAARSRSCSRGCPCGLRRATSNDAGTCLAVPVPRLGGGRETNRRRDVIHARVTVAPCWPRGADADRARPGRVPHRPRRLPGPRSARRIVHPRRHQSRPPR